MKKKRIEWTPEKCDELRRMYNTCDVNEIAVYFGCSVTAIYRLANKIGLKKENRITGRPWSDEHNRIMFELWPDKKEIARRVGRTVNTVTEHARKNGLRLGFAPALKWTEEQDDLLRELYPQAGRKRTAGMMGLPEQAVKSRAKKMGLRAESHHWSNTDIALLKEKFQTCDKYELESVFNRSRYCIYAKAYQLGLAKGSGFISDASVKNWMRQSLRARSMTDIVEGIIEMTPSVLELKKAQIVLARKLKATGYKPAKPKFWTSEKDTAIMSMYPSYRVTDILDKIGCSRSAFHKRAKYLGLGKKNRIAI